MDWNKVLPTSKIEVWIVLILFTIVAMLAGVGAFTIFKGLGDDFKQGFHTGWTQAQIEGKETVRLSTETLKSRATKASKE